MPSSSTTTKKSTTVRRQKRSDEPGVSPRTDGERTKREHSKSKISSHRRISMTVVGEPSVSTKTDGEGTKREHSKSRIASHRRSSMTATGEPSVSTKTDGDRTKREHSKGKISSQHRGRRSSMTATGEPSVSPRADGDGTKRDRSKSKISSQHRGRRSSMSAVIDSSLECPGFLMGGLIARDSSVRKRSSDSPGKHISGSPGKHLSDSPGKHISGSPSKQRSSSRISTQGSSSSPSKRPSGSLDHFGSSPSKRGSKSPGSTRTAQTQSSSSSREDSSKLFARPQGQRKTSQDSIKLLVASIDIDFTDDFKMGESTVSTAVKKSEKARQERLASVDPTDSPETDSHRETEIAWPKRERKPSVAASGTSRTMAIRSSVWTNPARPKVAESEAPETPEGLDAQKPRDGGKMRRRMSNPAVAAASTVLARTVASSSAAITTAPSNSDQPVRPKRRSMSLQPGGRVRRMSLRASGQSEGDKEITFPGAEFTAREAIPFGDNFDEKEKSILAYSPKRSPRKVILHGDLPATPRRLEGSTFAPVTPSESTKSSKSGSSKKSPSSKTSRKSQSTPTGLASKSPKHKIIKDDDHDRFGTPSQSHAPRTNKSLKSTLHKLRPSRRASLTGEDDAKSVVSTISRLQRRTSFPSGAKAQEPANVIVW
jgi:hypothetical protein